MYENGSSESSNGVHDEGMKCAIGDLKDFLAVMCHYYDINFDWNSYQETIVRFQFFFCSIINFYLRYFKFSIYTETNCANETCWTKANLFRIRNDNIHK